MNAVSSTPEAVRAADRTASARLLGALPLLSVYLWLSVAYMVEVWRRPTPWLFGDELEHTQLARAIADTGHPARRGTPISVHAVYDYLLAPLWLIHHVATAYAGIKYLDVLVMTSVVFPTYFLARLVVGRRASLLAAAGAGLAPVLAYSGYIIEENIAYPYAALCFFLCAKSLTALQRGQRARWWILATVVTALAAPFVRSELGVVIALELLALLFVGWSSDRIRAWRRGWSYADWLGAVLLVLGAIFAISAVGTHRSFAWEVATRLYKHEQLNMIGWAAGALAIGLGVLPLVAGLAALVPVRGERRSPELRSFRSTALAALVCFGLYTGIKTAYLSYSFGTRVEERNLVYLVPLLFVGLALVLERRRVNGWALLGGALLGAYLVGYAAYHAVGFPYEMNVQLYSDALGLAILQQANRAPFYWTPDTARLVLLALTAGGALLLAAVVHRRVRPRLASVLTGVLVVVVVGWTATAEIAAAAASNRTAREAEATLKRPFSWVDDITKGAPTLYMGVGEADQNPENLLEFWNRSIVRVSSLDGTIGGPGPAAGPNLTATGQPYWSADPARPNGVYAYAVEDFPCVDFAGTTVAKHPHRAGGKVLSWRLVRLTRPNRLRAMCLGIYPDGWTGPADSTYFRFAERRPGWLRIVVSRRDWGGPTGPSPVHVQVGPLRINTNVQPELASVERQTNGSIGSSQSKVVWIRTPGRAFAARVVVDDKFIPHEVDPSSSDTRPLGAEVTYHWFATLPPHAKPTGSGF